MKKIVYRKHAVDMMQERGVTKKQVEETLQKGSKFKQTDGFLAKYSYISVAYKVKGDKYIIKTVYID